MGAEWERWVVITVGHTGLQRSRGVTEFVQGLKLRKIDSLRRLIRTYNLNMGIYFDCPNDSTKRFSHKKYLYFKSLSKFLGKV